MKKALLIIDMQNAYLKGNVWECQDMDIVSQNIMRLIKKFNQEDVYFTKFIKPLNPKGMWKEFNKIYQDVNNNEYLNDYVDELKPYLNVNNLYCKDTYSSLSNKELYDKIVNYDEIYITGVVADCCILSTIYRLIDMGKKVIYCKDAIGAPNYEVSNAVITILKGLSPLHIEFKD